MTETGAPARPEPQGKHHAQARRDHLDHAGYDLGRNLDADHRQRAGPLRSRNAPHPGGPRLPGRRSPSQRRSSSRGESSPPRRAAPDPTRRVTETKMAEGDTIIEGPLYAARKKVYPQAVSGVFRRVSGRAGRRPRRLLPAALRALEPRAEHARPGRARRFPGPPLLLLHDRAVAAGNIFFYRAARHRRHGAVPHERRRGPCLVRLHVSADRVDGLVLRRGALGRG